MEVFPHQSNVILWRSYDCHQEIWLEVIIDVMDWQIRYATDDVAASKLLRTIRKAASMNPDFAIGAGYNIWTKLDFERTWGLGSSSTLISLVAQWIGVDAYLLGQVTFGGSGYDIACAIAKGPIVYKRSEDGPCVIPVTYFPDFHKQMCFVHLNKKKNTDEAIKKIKTTKVPYLENYISRIDHITNDMLNCNVLADFHTLIEDHELIVSRAFGMPTIKDQIFSDFAGSIKSLGAWGGDFVLASSKEPIGKTITYFNLKGYRTVILFEDMIIQRT
ncbi:MAG: GHMP kinase [Bacteroidia bacterium]|nr:GHMP kinase [Bacteroidia bacterium]